MPTVMSIALQGRCGSATQRRLASDECRPRLSHHVREDSFLGCGRAGFVPRGAPQSPLSHFIQRRRETRGHGRSSTLWDPGSAATRVHPSRYR
jgi:hypothetical protein